MEVKPKASSAASSSVKTKAEEVEAGPTITVFLYTHGWRHINQLAEGLTEKTRWQKQPSERLSAFSVSRGAALCHPWVGWDGVSSDFEFAPWQHQDRRWESYVVFCLDEQCFGKLIREEVCPSSSYEINVFDDCQKHFWRSPKTLGRSPKALRQSPKAYFNRQASGRCQKCFLTAVKMHFDEWGACSPPKRSLALTN